MAFIYGIYSPVSFKIRIVGQSKREPRVRLNEHYSHALNGRLVCEAECLWVQELAKRGLRPGIVVLEEVSEELLDEREQHWIKLGLELGWNLLNENTGGKGRPRGKEVGQGQS